MRTRITTSLVFVALALVVAGPAWAAPRIIVTFTEGSSETTTTVADPGGVGTETGIVPAVEAPPTSESESEVPWTQRFLAPAVLALGILGLVGSIAYYGVRIRARYRVVD
jgi:hypothetical protein